MKTIVLLIGIFLLSSASYSQFSLDAGSPTVKTANGILQGVSVSGISIFRGVPFAQPPVGELRWQEPRPVKNWEGIRKADHFSDRPMQLPIYSDMNFRSAGISEDCLYLNIWTPAKTGKEELAVLVYFYGGGLKAGDASEYRYDGESMARRGIVTVTVNYRLGIFGFMAHPELTKESAHHASGNYGYMDQTEALRWVKKNIAAFGGNPDNITIAGESAGSSSVNALVLSPLPRNLFQAAIAESGSLMNFNSVITLAESEKIGLAFAAKAGAASLKDLRAMSADQVLKASADLTNIPVDVDGYFFPESPAVLYKGGKAAHVPLLIGWNSEEAGWRLILGTETPTLENYKLAVKKLYPANADEILKLYSANNDEDVSRVATELATDRQNAFGSWRWSDLHAKSGSPVYRYFFTKARPREMKEYCKPAAENKEQNPSAYFRGAAHSAEIEYALGNLPSNRVYDWQPEDYVVSAVIQDYFLNFIKTKNPNGTALPYWPLYQSWQKDPVLHIGIDTRREPERRARYLFFEKIGTR